MHLTYIGDGNNVCQSLMDISTLCGFDMSVISPKNYAPQHASETIQVTDDISSVISKTNVIYTDVWVSMGDEHESEDRLAAFQPFQVSKGLLSQAKDDCIFYCLPANIGQEVTDEVFESAIKVFDWLKIDCPNGIMDWIIKEK